MMEVSHLLQKKWS